jgi:hypothetical protein
MCERAAARPPLGYCRDVDLPRLVALWPTEIADTSEFGRLRLLARLRTALRGERQRGIAGHWSYDLARHHQLLAAYRAEAEALLQMQRSAPSVFARSVQGIHGALTMRSGAAGPVVLED